MWRQSCVAVLADLGYDEGIDMLIESDAEEQADMIRAVRTPACLCPPVRVPLLTLWARLAGVLVAGGQEAHREEVRAGAGQAARAVEGPRLLSTHL